MAKYDTQIQDLPSLLASAKSVLIALSPQVTTDELASALGLSLALQKSGKQSTVVTEATPTVSHANLFGVGDVKNSLPTTGAGNFIITLENVVDPSGQMQTVPALEKLDWHPEGSNLNLVFHVIPGQRFEPSKVNFKHESQGFDLIFVIGAGSLTELGTVYSSNTPVFESSPVVNIDIASSNTNFGKYNIVDPNASSLSEVVTHLMSGLNLTLDNDIATDLITGIYEATSNMTQRVSADTFQAAAQMISAGARLPQVSAQVTGDSGQVVQPVQQAQPEPVQPQVISQQVPASTDVSLGGPVSTPVLEQTAPLQPEPKIPETQTQTISTDAGIASSPWLSAEPQIQFQPSFTTPQPAAPSVTPQLEVVPPAQTADHQSEQAQIQSQLNDFKSQPDAGGFDLRQVFQLQQMPDKAQPVQKQGPSENFVSSSQDQHPEQNQPEVPVPSQPLSQNPQPQRPAGFEEKPVGEYAISSSPEMDGAPTPDWLVPKIFKGGNLG